DRRVSRRTLLRWKRRAALTASATRLCSTGTAAASAAAFALRGRLRRIPNLRRRLRGALRGQMAGKDRQTDESRRYDSVFRLHISPQKLAARGASPPLARPAALEDSLSSGGLSIGCSWGPTPTRPPCGARRLALLGRTFYWLL